MFRRERIYNAPEKQWDVVKPQYQIHGTPDQVQKPMKIYTTTPNLFTLSKADVLENVEGKKDGFLIQGSIYMMMQFDSCSLPLGPMSAIPMRISFRNPVVTFDKNGGDTEPSVEKVTVEGGSSIDKDSLTEQSMPQPPTRKNYLFMGWAEKPDATTPDFTGETVVNEDKTVYAVWKYDGYSVKYDANGGSASMLSTAGF